MRNEELSGVETLAPLHMLYAAVGRRRGGRLTHRQVDAPRLPVTGARFTAPLREFKSAVLFRIGSVSPAIRRSGASREVTKSRDLRRPVYNRL